MMPLSERVVRRIADTAAAWRFERIYGAFPGRNVMADGNAAVERSASRYIDLLNDREALGGVCGRLPSRHETHRRVAVPGQHDLFPAFGATHQLGELSLRFADGNLHGDELD